MMRNQASQRGVRFGTDDDADDYYDYLSSESADEDEQGADAGSVVARNGTEAIALVGKAKDGDAEMPTVLKSVRFLDILEDCETEHRHVQQPHVSERSRDKTFVNQDTSLSVDALNVHLERKLLLENTLDAALLSSKQIDAKAAGLFEDAPFRFQGQPADVVMTSPDATPAPAERTAPAKKRSTSQASDDADLLRNFEQDPLYDPDMDDADNHWVQSNLKPSTSQTDAVLCCPCCFLTICLDCQRHIKYPNQYRASTAVNCCVQRDQKLRYATNSTISPGKLATLPFVRDSSSDSQLRLQKDEYYAVECSDCRTTVGVYDCHKHFHFFNVLPGEC
ncbi:TPA: hypothetical protein N0F65_008417 [Lagenidium giganteum]|uniref:E2F-associated phosphoprotein n=1 Tax=Lagenidium giganteum TaxID=4803 RepID=A0AAV2YVM2_9STRA|nr:TPA: hypothetical protein N0F65_008417 [Lagenidium giganteum]